MNNEIRQAHRLSEALEDEIFELQEQSWELLDAKKINLALEKIKMAWEKLPEPKFNTSCSHIILCDMVEILNLLGNHTEAREILKDWIFDLENSGYKIYITTPFILLGETFLFLEEIDEAKLQFYKAVELGATKRDFSDKPSFYFEIAQKKITENDAILKLLDVEIVENDNSLDFELTEIVAEEIESLSEEGNEYFDDEEYEKAIISWTDALNLIPQPQNSFSESLWLETSIGDAFFMAGEHDSALPHFLNAKNNLQENAYENPFIMLRIGQLYFEKGDLKNAKEFLLRAYMLDGIEIFEGSKEKYFLFLSKNVKL